jgi:hypothetical protein
VNAIAAQTNRLITSAAIAVASTNLFLPSPFSANPWDVAASTHGQHSTYQFTISTSFAFERIDNEPSDATNAVARTLVQVGIRWNNYVARRLVALRTGASDFTGLKVPSSWVVDRAWAVANKYFKPATPPPSVVPTEDGDILYVWRKAGWELHLEISSEETTAWAYHRKSGRAWSGSLGERLIEFYTLLDQFGQV